MDPTGRICRRRYLQVSVIKRSLALINVFRLFYFLKCHYRTTFVQSKLQYWVKTLSDVIAVTTTTTTLPTSATTPVNRLK